LLLAQHSVFRDQDNLSLFDVKMGVLDGIHVTGYFASSVSKKEKK
jgi:hypothetical protein